MKEETRLKLPAGIVILGLFLGFSILGTSVIKARDVQVAVAEETAEVTNEDEIEVNEEETTNVEDTEAVEETEEGIDYYLPYPGILPDHPLYWLKMIRDRVQLWLTTKPVAKAEKMLLYADKRLGAGWALVEGNKQELGVTTLTKGEKYLEKAMIEAENLGEDGEAVKLIEKLNKATKKHQEVLEIITEKLEGKQKEVVEGIRPLKPVKELEDSEASASEELRESGELIEYEGEEGKTVLEMLEESGEEITKKEYDFGTLVEAIGDKENTAEKAWIYFVNGESGQVAADEYELEAGDKVEWKYIKPEF